MGERLTKALGVPVVDPAFAAIKYAELLCHPRPVPKPYFPPGADGKALSVTMRGMICLHILSQLDEALTYLKDLISIPSVYLARNKPSESI